ncbi:MAG: hypothetical protein J6R42_01125, partial [Clostridia bacterium]|nr:hypothetical protein [Clostridia bacterium]
MKIKKSYLYSAIALLLVGAAVFFAIFGNNGNVYNYEKKNLGKYLSGMHYADIDISGVVFEQVNDENLMHYTAKQWLEVIGNKNPKDDIIAKYGLVNLLYWGVVDGEIFTPGALMNPLSPTKVQMNSDNKLAELFAELLEKDTADYHYNFVVSGYLHADDTIYVNLLMADGSKKENVKIELSQGKDAVDAEYGVGFYDALLEQPIGMPTQTKTFGEGENAKQYTAIMVNWATRNSLDIGPNSPLKDVVTGQDSEGKDIKGLWEVNPETDTLYVTITTKSQENAQSIITYVARITGKGAGAVDFDVYNQTKNQAGGIDVALIQYIFGGRVNASELKVQYIEQKGLTEFAEGKSYVTYDAEYTAVAADAKFNDKTEYFIKNGDVYVSAGDIDAFEDGVAYFTCAYKYNPVAADAQFDASKTYYLNLGQEYQYTVDRVVRTGTENNPQIESATYLEISKEYPADSQETVGDNISVAGKTVTYYVIPVSVANVDFSSFDTSYGALKTVFNTEDAAKLKAIDAAVAAYESAITALKKDASSDEKILIDAYVNAFEAYKVNPSDTALKDAYDAARAAAITEANKAKATTYETAYDTIETKIKDFDSEATIASTNVLADKKEDKEKWILSKCPEVFDEAVLESLQDTLVADYRLAVAELLWDTIVADTTFSELPARALRLAKKDILNQHKSTYYAQ